MRLLLKRALQYTCFMMVSPLILLSCRRLGAVGDFFHYLSATLLAIVPGRIGGYFRVAFYKGVCDHVAWDMNIGFGTFFTKRTIRIGNNVSLGAYCLIGSAHIGENCQIASRVSIPSGKHQHRIPGDSDKTAQNAFVQVMIGPRTWIGEAVVVLADIGSDCVVGAGSVVTHRVRDGEIVAGNPAKPIERNSSPLDS